MSVDLTSHILDQYQHYVQEHQFHQVNPIMLRKVRNVMENFRDYTQYPEELPDDMRICFKFLKEAFTISNDIFCEYFYHNSNHTYAVRYYYFDKTLLFFIDFEEVATSSGRTVYKIKVNKHICDSLEDMVQYFMDLYLDLIH